MDGGQLDPEPFDGTDELVDEAVITSDLAQAVADAARCRALLSIPDQDLVLDRSQHLVAELLDIGEDTPEDLSRREVAGRSVGPAGRGETDTPTRSPRQIPEGVDLRVNDQVGGPRADPEALVVGDGRIHRVQPEDEVRHHGAVLDGRLERVRPERLAPDRAVDVGDPEEDELLPRGPAAHARLGRESSITRSTSSMVAAKRSTISVSSSSELTYAGAMSVWSPANPSACGWVDVTRSPCSSAVSSTRAAASSSTGRKDSPSRGSTSSTPSKNPRPRTSRTIWEPSSAASSSSRSLGPRSRTRSTRPRSTRRSTTAKPTAEDTGAPSQVCPRSNPREPRSIAS